MVLKQNNISINCKCFVLQAYENYSFEELRYATPSVPRPSENMLVRSADDGTYLANWTPSSIGLYNIFVSVDGFETGVLNRLSLTKMTKDLY